MSERERERERQTETERERERERPTVMIRTQTTHKITLDNMELKAFTISSWNIQCLRSSAFGLMSRNLDFVKKK